MSQPYNMCKGVTSILVSPYAYIVGRVHMYIELMDLVYFSSWLSLCFGRSKFLFQLIETKFRPIENLRPTNPSLGRPKGCFRPTQN